MSIGEVENRNVLVVGLGRFGGGIGVARWLCSRGARVIVTDLADREALADSVDQLAGCQVTFHLGGHDPEDLDFADLVVVSPAVDRRRSDFFTHVLERRIPWTTEINLFLQRCPGQVIGVTGTAGKSTTCALVHEVLAASILPRRVWFGGNVGGSLLGDLPEIGPEDVVILELSSFQLETVEQIEKSPPIGVITNIWPNHLDRHGGFEAYLGAKLNLLRYQRPGDRVVVGWVDEAVRAAVGRVAARTGAELIRVPEPVEPYRLGIPGVHNQRNAACANVVSRLLGVDDATARTCMAEFAGLPHRLQHVGSVGGVDYYNDSKSTTPQGAATALDAFEAPVVAIVGGHERGDELGPLVEALVTKVKAVVCTGACGLRIAEAVRSARSDRGRPAVANAADLSEAVHAAHGLARSGDVIMLSPGAPSYGEFVNYEQRGRAFMDLVRALARRQ